MRGFLQNFSLDTPWEICHSDSNAAKTCGTGANGLRLFQSKHTDTPAFFSKPCCPTRTSRRPGVGWPAKCWAGKRGCSQRFRLVHPPAPYVGRWACALAGGVSKFNRNLVCGYSRVQNRARESHWRTAGRWLFYKCVGPPFGGSTCSLLRAGMARAA